MTLENLENLVKINQLKVELPDQKEFDGMIASAKRRLQDAQAEGLSDEGRFSLAYGSVHAISLAARHTMPGHESASVAACVSISTRNPSD